MAAYMSELAFVASPVSSHVQSAEMGNQAINSMALVSARYTHLAVELLALMLSTHLFSLCQALDLRAMDAKFRSSLAPLLLRISTEIFGPVIECALLLKLHGQATKRLLTSLDATTTMDSYNRFETVAEAGVPVWLGALPKDGTAGIDMLALICAWKMRVADESRELFEANRALYMAEPDATPYLGAASSRMYAFVRTKLAVQFHRGLVDHPTFPEANGAINRKKATIGSSVSVIYEALRSKRLTEVVMECLAEAQLD
jgi:phenylalanine ammonia-lyase